MGKRFRLSIALSAALGLLWTGCYKEEHFDMPGSAEEIDHSEEYSVPDPFDGSNTVYLIKDGVPDFTKMTVIGFTDFAVEMPATPDTLSWRQGTDRNGELYFGCRQHKINYALDNINNYGGTQLSYMYNALYSRLYLKNGPGRQWKVKARVAMEVFGCSALSNFAFEGGKAWTDHSVFGFDWTSNSNPYFHMLRATSLLAPLDGGNVVNMANYMSPCEPFEMEICCVDNFFYVRFGEKVLWGYTAEDVPEHEFPLIFYPWMGAVRFYDLSIEGDYVMQEPVAVQREQGYVNIQAPALAAVGGELLLFAEGRQEVTVQSANMASVRSNATDILIRRSSDHGQTWSEWKVLKGGDGKVYMRPEVINAGDKLYLFYTVDVNGKQEGNYQIAYMESVDGGEHWTQETAVNVQLDGYTVSTLSGHGIKTSDGELILPLQCRMGNRGTVAALYSEDNGNTWEMGETVPGLRNNSGDILEVDGKLVMYISHSSSATSRKISSSTDGGKTWCEAVDTSIPTGIGGFQTGGATVVGGDGTIYHFTPVNAEKTSLFSGSSLGEHPQTTIRNQKKLYIYNPEIDLLGSGVTLTVSRDGGKTWSSARDLTGITSYEGYIFPTGAMDATVCDDMVILVTEGGVAVPYEGLLLFRESVN